MATGDNGSQRDALFADPLAPLGRFVFDEQVAAVFPDMIERSVPGYPSIVATTGLLAGRFAQPDTLCYDLGCSLGATTLAMRRQIVAPNCRIIAVDNSAAMIERAKRVIATDLCAVEVELRLADVNDLEIASASVVAMNFTLQFISPQRRDALIANIYRGLNEGGALILSEKVVVDDPQLDPLFIDLHHDFKRAFGYSALEISRKRTALENVLIPESVAAHRQRLCRAGFESVAVWFQCLNFAAFIAIKGRALPPAPRVAQEEVL